MNNREPDRTIKAPLRVRLMIKGSRFIASMAPANTEEEAADFINSLLKEFPDATHHTYAYRVGFSEARIERSSDAREPAGTAGPPMLQAINRAGVTNVVVVATRYFGGTKLGIGGLIRAYRCCVQTCLDKAQLVEIKELSYFKGVFAYDDLGSAIRHIESYDGGIHDIGYAEQVTVKFSVPATAEQELISALEETTRGRVKIKKVDGAG